MLIPGDQWPIFIYTRYEYDPEDAWKGAFRNYILVSVSKIQINFNQCSELRLGILIHVHFVEFHGQGFEGNKIRECMPPWDDQSNTGIHPLYYNTSKFI